MVVLTEVDVIVDLDVVGSIAITREVLLRTNGYLRL